MGGHCFNENGFLPAFLVVPVFLEYQTLQRVLVVLFLLSLHAYPPGHELLQRRHDIMSLEPNHELMRDGGYQDSSLVKSWARYG